MKEVFGGFSLALSPFVEVWLEESLVELSHASESCPPVEEVKLFVVLFYSIGTVYHGRHSPERHCSLQELCCEQMGSDGTI